MRTVKLLTLLMLMLIGLPAAVQAQFTFTTNNGAITITGYTGSSVVVTVPGTTNGLSVTSIGNSAFYNKSNLTFVAIPDSVTNIGSSAFYSCSSMTNLTLGTNVINIGVTPPFLSS